MKKLNSNIVDTIQCSIYTVFLTSLLFGIVLIFPTIWLGIKYMPVWLGWSWIITIIVFIGCIMIDKTLVIIKDSIIPTDSNLNY